MKNKNIIFFEIPDYPELAVKNVWPLVKENEDLLKFFHDFKPSQLPEKEFMYGVLSSIRPDGVRELVAQSVKLRSSSTQEENDDLIEVTCELKRDISQLFSMKSK